MRSKANLQLIQIVDYDFDNFSVEALNAAKAELASRKLSEDQIQILRTEIEKTSVVQKIQESVKEKILSQDEKIKSELGDEQSKFWYLFLVLVGAMFLVPLIRTIWWSIIYGVSIHDIPSIIQFILFGFIFERCLQKKKIAWLLLFYSCSLFVATSILNLILALDLYFESSDYGNEYFTEVNSFFDTYALQGIAVALSIIFYQFLILWIQSKDKIRKMYKISAPEYNKHLKYAFLAGLGVALLVFFIGYIA